MCIRSLEQWEEQERGIKYTEVSSGREYEYCMHTFIGSADISNATLISVNFWYNATPMLPGHAIVEMVFEHRDKFIIVINEGLRQSTHGMVACHQIYSNDTRAGANYLAERSIYYRSLLKKNIHGNNKRFFRTRSTHYNDVLNGPIKETNCDYVHVKWKPADISHKRIILNHGCLWYACSLFSKLIGISVHELLSSPNISGPIIELQKSVSDSVLSINNDSLKDYASDYDAFETPRVI